MYKLLETERLIIRPIALSDTDFILRLVNSDGWLKFIGERNIKTEEDSKKYITKILDNKNFYYSVFELKDTQKAIGIITFLNREEFEHPDIGFALLPEFEKKGYSFEAAKKYLDEIQSNNIAKTIIGITLPENIGSIKLLEKLGLKYKSDFVKDDEKLLLFELIIN